MGLLPLLLVLLLLLRVVAEVAPFPSTRSRMKSVKAIGSSLQDDDDDDAGFGFV